MTLDVYRGRKATLQQQPACVLPITLKTLTYDFNILLTPMQMPGLVYQLFQYISTGELII